MDRPPIDDSFFDGDDDGVDFAEPNQMVTFSQNQVVHEGMSSPPEEKRTESEGKAEGE